MRIDRQYFIVSSMLLIILVSVTHIPVYAYNSTSPTTSSFNNTKSLSNQTNTLNYTVTMAIYQAKNSTQFQNFIKGYNYSFDDIFEYVRPNPQQDSGSKIYAIDFSLYKGPIPFHEKLNSYVNEPGGPISLMAAVGVVTVWEDPTLKVVSVTSSGMGFIRGPGGPAIGNDIISLCHESAACYLRYFSIPPEAASVCNTPLGCDIVRLGGPSIHIGKSNVPEFPFAIPILVISFVSLVIFRRINIEL